MLREMERGRNWTVQRPKRRRPRETRIQLSFLDGIRFPTGLYVTMRDGDIRHSGSDSSDGQYNKEFQLSLALFLSSAEGIEKEQSTLWKGRKLLFPSISRNKKKNKGAIEQHVSRKAVQGESARIYRFSFVFFCRSITSTAKKGKKREPRWLHFSVRQEHNKSLQKIYENYCRMVTGSPFFLVNGEQQSAGGFQNKMAIFLKKQNKNNVY